MLTVSLYYGGFIGQEPYLQVWNIGLPLLPKGLVRATVGDPTSSGRWLGSDLNEKRHFDFHAAL